MDLKQMELQNQIKLYDIGNTIIQGELPKTNAAERLQSRYRQELNEQIRMKNESKLRDRLRDRAMDHMHLDTITYAPVGNPLVSDRRNEHFQTSYQTQYATPTANNSN